MNKSIKRLDLEKIIFFDIEVVRSEKELSVDSKEFELFQKKIRDKVTDEYPTEEDTIKEYNKRAGLRMCYNKIVCISCGVVKSGKLYIKSYTGSEEEIVTNFINKLSEYNLVCGFNIKNYDLPIVQINAFKYPDTPYMPERFSVSDKKPWNLGEVIDLMDVIKGTYFVNVSMDEACYHFDVKSSKEDGIDGSMVSDVYYNGGLNEIVKYCERDVVATVNLLMRLRREPIFYDFIVIEDKVSNSPLITAIGLAKEVSDKHRVKLLEEAKSLSIAEKERLVDIVKACLAKTKFEKEEEELFSELLK